MNEPREVEAKFETDDVAPLLDAIAFPPLRIARKRTLHQHDTYLDTKDDRLKAASSTLRIRASAGLTTMTFKGPRELMTDDMAHVASRPEINERIAASDAAELLAGKRPDSMPAPLSAAQRNIGDATLRPVATIENHRVAIDLVDADGNTFELAVDRCIGTRISDGRQIVFGEIELEAKSAPHAAFVAAVEALIRAVPSLRPSHQTKLGRVLS